MFDFSVDENNIIDSSYWFVLNKVSYVFDHYQHVLYNSFDIIVFEFFPLKEFNSNLEIANFE